MSWDELEALLEDGLSPAEAVDYVAVESHGYTQTAWAQKRGVSQPVVAENVSKAKRELASVRD